MQISTTPLKRCTLVNLKGRFDSNTSPDLQKAIREILDAGVFRIVLDMEGVEFFGSAAIRVLVMTYKECRRWNRGDVRLCRVPERIVRVLDLAGISPLVQMFDDCTLAVGSF
ncbi:MAG: STAS domain-containing protein [Chloroflexi bacterium]|nr:STAS domain-containing protein [Chloroflexota bacterium]